MAKKTLFLPPGCGCDQAAQASFSRSRVSGISYLCSDLLTFLEALQIVPVVEGLVLLSKTACELGTHKGTVEFVPCQPFFVQDHMFRSE